MRGVGEGVAAVSRRAWPRSSMSGARGVGAQQGSW